MIGQLNTNISLDGTIKSNITLDGKIEVSLEGYERYRGTYSVEPTTTEQVLNSRDKVLLNDIRIGAIPYEEEDNEYGKTISIG